MIPSRLILAAAPLLLAGSVACSQQPAAVGPAAPQSGWTITTSPRTIRLQGFAEDQDLSGIAAWDKKNLLVVTDEGISVLPGTMDAAGVITAKEPLIPVLTAPGELEADTEGVAVIKEDKCYYVTGSLGVGKKRGDFQPGRTNVYRVPVDPATGEAKGDGVTVSKNLFSWVEKHPVLREYARQPLQLNGFNIEGLAAKDGKLWFGVRGPNIRGAIHVIETTPASLFGDGELEATLHSLPTGIDAIGIREIAAVKEGFIILTGNASAEVSKRNPKSLAPPTDSKFQLWLWQPGGNPAISQIGTVPRFPGKSEGLLVLEDTDEFADVVILHDSEAQGGARVVRLTKKKAK